MREPDQMRCRAVPRTSVSIDSRSLHAEGVRLRYNAQPLRRRPGFNRNPVCLMALLVTSRSPPCAASMTRRHCRLQNQTLATHRPRERRRRLLVRSHPPPARNVPLPTHPSRPRHRSPQRRCDRALPRDRSGRCRGLRPRPGIGNHPPHCQAEAWDDVAAHVNYPTPHRSPASPARTSILGPSESGLHPATTDTFSLPDGAGSPAKTRAPARRTRDHLRSSPPAVKDGRSRRCRTRTGSRRRLDDPTGAGRVCHTSSLDHTVKPRQSTRGGAPRTSATEGDRRRSRLPRRGTST